MIFIDREEAGERLAIELKKFKKKKNVLVLASPRGGVVIGAKISEILNIPLDIVVTRKIGAPNDQEYAIGAINEEGVGVFNQAKIENFNILDEYLKTEVKKEKKEAQRRVDLYRNGSKELAIEGKEIIIVDDGIATGLTMIAAIKAVKTKNPRKIIVAVPVSARDSLEKIKNLVDETICLYVPEFFGSVGAFYQNFDSVEDEDVISIINLNKK